MTTPIRRMPTAFGPSISPRQGPDGLPFPSGAAGAQRRTVLSFLARSDRAALEQLLPARVELSGDPRVRISVIWLQGLGFDYSEMATETNTSMRTVERQLMKARRNLRRLETAGGAG